MSSENTKYRPSFSNWQLMEYVKNSFAGATVSMLQDHQNTVFNALVSRDLMSRCVKEGIIRDYQEFQVFEELTNQSRVGVVDKRGINLKIAS